MSEAPKGLRGWTRWPGLAAAAAYAGMKAFVRWDRGRGDPERVGSFADSAGPSLYATAPDGRRIHASVSGEGEDAVFCVHGWCCRGDFFHYQRALAAGRKVITVDLRGHGGSDPDAGGGHSVEKFAADLRAAVDAVAPRRFVLVGHSMGGYVSFTFHRLFWEEYSGRLAGLVVLDSTGIRLFDGVPGGERLRGLLRRPAVYGALGRLAARPRFLEWALARLKGTDLAYFLFRVLGFGPRPSPSMLGNIIEMTLGGPVPALLMDIPACLDYEGEGGLSEVRAPVLLVTGNKDFIANASTNRRTLERLADAELRVLRSGHGCPLDRHAEVNGAVERFLERVMRDGGG